MDRATERTARLFLQRVREHYDLAGALLFGSRARLDAASDSVVRTGVLRALAAQTIRHIN